MCSDTVWQELVCSGIGRSCLEVTCPDRRPSLGAVFSRSQEWVPVW